jgi:hypothetical protein
MPEPTAMTRPRGRWERARDGGLGLLAGLAIGGVAAGFVYVDGRERLARLDADRAAQAVEVEQGVASVRGELAASRAFESLLRARVAADQALNEHDRANFGLSRERLRSVGVALAAVEPSLVSVDAAALTEARAQVDAALNEVAPDALAQRDRLVAVVRAVDGLIPKEPLG